MLGKGVVPMRCEIPIPRWFAWVIVLVVLAGCGDTSTGTNPTEAVSSESATEQTSEPQPEPTDPESPQPSQSKPSLKIAGLPIGGGGGTVNGDRQCVPANWLGGTKLRDGVAVTVRKITLSRKGIFRLDQKSCGSKRACAGMRWVTSNQKKTCYIGGRQIGPDDDEGSVEIAIGGVVTCNRIQDCRHALEDPRPDSVAFAPQPDIGQPSEPPPSDSPPPDTPTPDQPTTTS